MPSLSSIHSSRAINPFVLPNQCREHDERCSPYTHKRGEGVSYSWAFWLLSICSIFYAPTPHTGKDRGGGGGGEADEWKEHHPSSHNLASCADEAGSTWGRVWLVARTWNNPNGGERIDQGGDMAVHLSEPRWQWFPVSVDDQSTRAGAPSDSPSVPREAERARADSSMRAGGGRGTRALNIGSRRPGVVVDFRVSTGWSGEILVVLRILCWAKWGWMACAWLAYGLIPKGNLLAFYLFWNFLKDGVHFKREAFEIHPWLIFYFILFY